MTIFDDDDDDDGDSCPKRNLCFLRPQVVSSSVAWSSLVLRQRVGFLGFLMPWQGQQLQAPVILPLTKARSLVWDLGAMEGKEVKPGEKMEKQN